MQGPYLGSLHSCFSVSVVQQRDQRRIYPLVGYRLVSLFREIIVKIIL